MVITITVTDTVPHTTDVVTAQTAFTYPQHQANPSLCHSTTSALCSRVQQQLRAATGPAVLCTDGVLRVRKR